MITFTKKTIVTHLIYKTNTIIYFKLLKQNKNITKVSIVKKILFQMIKFLYFIQHQEKSISYE